MKKNIKNLIIIPDYIDPSKHWDKFSKSFAKNINVITFDWSSLYKNKDNINLDVIKTEIKKFITNKKINQKDSIVVSKGISSIYLMDEQLNLQFSKCLLVNPYIATSIINPYTSKIPTYKNVIDNYWKKLKKEYFDLSKVYSSIEDKDFITAFDWYQTNFDFLDKITGYINDYIYLNKIRKNENNYNFSNCFTVLAKNNNVLNYKKQLNFMNKKSNEITSFDQCSHNIEIDKSNELINLVKNLINS